MSPKKSPRSIRQHRGARLGVGPVWTSSRHVICRASLGTLGASTTFAKKRRSGRTRETTRRGDPRCRTEHRGAKDRGRAGGSFVSSQRNGHDERSARLVVGIFHGASRFARDSHVYLLVVDIEFESLSASTVDFFEKPRRSPSRNRQCGIQSGHCDCFPQASESISIDQLDAGISATVNGNQCPSSYLFALARAARHAKCKRRPWLGPCFAT